jgi:hypothetical protein
MTEAGPLVDVFVHFVSGVLGPARNISGFPGKIPTSMPTVASYRYEFVVLSCNEPHMTL